MPEPAVKEALGPNVPGGDLSLDELEAGARNLKVSRPALALRLEQLGSAAPGYFSRVLEQVESETWRPRAAGGGPKYAVAVVAQLGSTYSSLVLRALESGVIDRNTASEMLNAPARQLGNVASRVSEQGERYAAGA